MTTFTYNGVELKMLKTNSIRREAEMASDGHTVIRFKWTFDVEGIYNPQATSASESGQSFSAGHLPAVTDQGIRDLLLVPRKAFTFQNGATTVLSLPPSGKTSDVANGPIPIHCTVRRIDGVKTWRVNYVLTCWTAPCRNAEKEILSHVYSMTHVVDEQELTTRTVEGEVVFAKTALRHYDPDDFRKDFAHPRPEGFVRNVQVRAMPDGLTIRYQITDRQLMVPYGPESPAGKIQAFHTIHGQHGLAFYEMMVIRAWGRKSSTLAKLIEQVVFIAHGKMPIPKSPTDTRSIIMDYKMTTELTDRFVELSVAIMTTADAKVAASLPLPTDRIDKQGTFFNNYLNETNRDNPDLPYSHDMRGTYLEKAVANALREPCVQISAPPRPGSARG